MKVKSAQATLNELRDWRALEELAQHIHDAVAAVRSYGKDAKVILEIVIAPMKGGQEKLVEPPLLFTAEVISKLPKPQPEATLFFTDEDGNPTRTQSRQRGLDLTVAVIDKSTGEIK
jgi:Ni2+-binding GTPase involved in maturation of urease and hydrogenase